MADINGCDGIFLKIEKMGRSEYVSNKRVGGASQIIEFLF